MDRVVLGFVVVTSIMLAFSGCGEKIDPVADPGLANITVNVYYTTDIKPILDGYCIRCHSSTLSGSARNGAPGDANFDAYQTILPELVNLSQKIAAGVMPPGGSGLPQAERDLFAAWVAQGAPESPQAPVRVTYFSAIKQLLDDNCILCHSTDNSGSDRNGAPSSVNFNTYTEAATSAAKARVRIEAGEMPPTGGLAQTDRDLFAAWLDAGTPEQ